MVRSIWKGALVLALGWVGLAWSQPSAKPPSDAGAQSSPIITVHENGKVLQCRVISSWRLPNGARAFQLEVVDTKEMMTIVEDGQGTTFQSRSGRMRSLPMRIFHWGRLKTPPPGVPVPPPKLISEREVGDPVILSESQSTLVQITPDPVPPPGSRIYQGSVPAGQGPGTAGLPGGPSAGQETGLPGVTASNNGSKNSAAAKVAGVPGANPGAGKPAEAFPGTNFSKPMPAGIPGSGKTAGTPAGVQTPGTLPGSIGGERPAVSSSAAGAAPREFPPAVLQGKNSIPETNLYGSFPGAGQGASTPMTGSPASLPSGGGLAGSRSVLPGPGTVSSVPAPASSPYGTFSGSGAGTGMPMTGSPASLPAGVGLPGSRPISPGSGFVQTLPGTNPSGLSPVVPGPGTVSSASPYGGQPVVPNENGTVGQGFPLPHQGVATGQPSGVRGDSRAMNNRPRTLWDRLCNLIHPQAKTSGKATAGQAPQPLTNRVGPNPTSEKGSQLAEMAQKKYPTQPGFQGNSGMNPGTAAPGQQGVPSAKQIPGSVAQTPGAGNTPVASGKMADKETPKKDWRQMWGKSLSSPSKPPGQSLSEPSLGKGPISPGLGEQEARKSAAQMPGILAPMPPASVTEKSQQPDPLLTPERYGPPKAETRAMEKAGFQAKNGPAPTLPSVPLGAQSVLNAHNGVDMPLRYVPVPMVTIPQPVRPPLPPAPEVPQAPAVNHFVNAFSGPKTALPPGAGGQPQGNPMARPMAPGPRAGGGGRGSGPQGERRVRAAAGCGRGGGAPNPYQQPGMAPMGQPVPQMAGWPNGGGAVGYGPHGSFMMPPQTSHQRPVAYINFPKTYQGPMPPNPVAGNYYPQPQMAATQPYHPPMMERAGFQAATMPMPSQNGGGFDLVAQMIGVLQESVHPAEREWAAMNLAAVDGQAHPAVIPALLTAARKDPAATVRAGCVNGLARQNVARQPVLNTLQALKSDPDPRVRTEAEQALVRLTGSHGTFPPQGVQQLGGKP